MKTTGNYSTSSESVYYHGICIMSLSLPSSLPNRFMEDHSTSSLIWNYKVTSPGHGIRCWVWLGTEVGVAMGGAGVAMDVGGCSHHHG